MELLQQGPHNASNEIRTHNLALLNPFPFPIRPYLHFTIEPRTSKL